MCDAPRPAAVDGIRHGTTVGMRQERPALGDDVPGTERVPTSITTVRHGGSGSSVAGVAAASVTTASGRPSSSR